MNLKKNKIIMIITIIINAIFFIIFPFSLIGAMVSPMMFDSPSSMENFYTWIIFFSTFSIPLVILISILTSLFFLLKLKLYKTALVFSLLPMINILAILLVIIVNKRF